MKALNALPAEAQSKNTKANLGSVRVRVSLGYIVPGQKQKGSFV